MLGRTGVAHYGRRCSWAHSEGHIGVAHYGILVGGPLQLRWQPIGRRCLWAHLGEVPTITLFSFAAQSLMERITKIIKNQFNITGSCQNVDDVSHVFMSFVFVFRCILQEYGLTVLFLINCFMF